MMISFEVKAGDLESKTIEVPGDMNLTLMEVLKASEYDIAATCGGIALCATCHVEVTRGQEKMGLPTDAELDMIDTLPDAKPNSRLACQIRIDQYLQGASFTLFAPAQR